MDLVERTVIISDDNIDEIRARYPDGLHFVVGDVHGQTATLKALMEKIKFDPTKDHVFFVGDYNGGHSTGGDIYALMNYMSLYYSADYNTPGFHLIRGNHECELNPIYPLRGFPHIIVYKGSAMNYYIVHAGMVNEAFGLINDDMAKHPDKQIHAYTLDYSCRSYDAPLRQMIWSRHGLYTQNYHRQFWAKHTDLVENKACIIHGHSPYCYFKKEDYYSYGEDNLFWQNQHIFFSESLQSFNIDSNIKGRYKNGEGHRAISCICIEMLEEIAVSCETKLTAQAVRRAPNFVFSADLTYENTEESAGDASRITHNPPESKRIYFDGIEKMYIED